ncbi:hypothetical protein S245_012879, partial [Arachis hypogaea]
RDPETGSRIPSISTGGAAMKAIINTEVAVNKVGIIKTPNHPIFGCATGGSREVGIGEHSSWGGTYTKMEKARQYAQCPCCNMMRGYSPQNKRIKTFYTPCGIYGLNPS